MDGWIDYMGKLYYQIPCSFFFVFSVFLRYLSFVSLTAIPLSCHRLLIDVNVHERFWDLKLTGFGSWNRVCCIMGWGG